MFVYINPLNVSLKRTPGAASYHIAYNNPLNIVVEPFMYKELFF